MTVPVSPRIVRSLAASVLWRLVAVLGVALLASAGAFAWLHHQANRTAQEQQLATTMRHFATRLGEIDRGWELAAKNLRTQIADARILDAATDWRERLTAHLASFADGLLFSDVFVVDKAGQVVFYYEPWGPSAVRLPSPLVGESGWIYEASDAIMYRWFALPMLMRGESGHRLVVLVSADNVLLNANVHPGVEAHLLWQDRVVASSQGNDVVGLSVSALAAAHTDHLGAERVWSDEPGAPRLVVHQYPSRSMALSEALLPFALAGALLALGGWFVLGGWLARLAARLDVLKQAAQEFSGADRAGVEAVAARIEASLRGKSPTDDLSDLAGVMATSMIARLRAEEALRVHQEHLEDLVQERTHQLTASIKELEAFAYSVSHDLRGPLRAIDGFSQMVMEDYGQQIDAAGREHLARVRQAAQRMAHLIDALLRLSRISRSPMERVEVDLSRMVQEIVEQLRSADPQRQVEVVVQEGMTASGDPGLLRALLENLLRNAWKYTSRQADAHIEFGATDSEGERAFFVRDNGAGFDMQHASKLFGAFQRLHRQDEFEGTGIGLATVQRIVQRHGGKVWAVGRVGEGATFNFTLAPARAQQS